MLIRVQDLMNSLPPNIRPLIILSVLVSLLGLLSCNPQKRLLRKQKAQERKLNKAGFDAFAYEALSIKSKLRFSIEGDETKATAYIRIRRDSAIWLSISKTTVEGLRVLATPDTVMVIDRLAKQFYAYNYQQLEEKFQFAFDYEMLQSAFTGEPYFPEGSKPSKRPTNTHYILRDRIGQLLVKQFIAKKNNKLDQVQAIDKENRELNITYAGFEEVEGQVFPHSNEIRVSYIREGEPKETKLDFEYNRVNIAEIDLKMPFKVNGKYEKVEIGEGKK